MLNAKENKIQSINGLFYLDISPVQIDIENGKIKRIIRLPESEKFDTYIAPGFIDIQINGYASVDFSGPDFRQ